MTVATASARVTTTISKFSKNSISVGGLLSWTIGRRWSNRKLILRSPYSRRLIWTAKALRSTCNGSYGEDKKGRPWRYYCRACCFPNIQEEWTNGMSRKKRRKIKRGLVRTSVVPSSKRVLLLFGEWFMQVYLHEPLSKKVVRTSYYLVQHWHSPCMKDGIVQDIPGAEVLQSKGRESALPVEDKDIHVQEVEMENRVVRANRLNAVLDNEGMEELIRASESAEYGSGQYFSKERCAVGNEQLEPLHM